MTAAPELVAVALLPVAVRVAAIGHLPSGGSADPGCRDQLLPLPFPLLQVELAKLGDVFGANEQPIAAEADPLRARSPRRLLDAQRFKQPGPQIVQHRLARHLLHDGRKYVGGRRVVKEMRSRLVRNGMRQERFHPGDIPREPRLRFVSGGHREQIADPHGLQVPGWLRRGKIREELQDLIVHSELAFLDGQPHRRGGEALAQRPHDVRMFRPTAASTSTRQ